MQVYVWARVGGRYDGGSLVMRLEAPVGEGGWMTVTCEGRQRRRASDAQYNSGFIMSLRRFVDFHRRLTVGENVVRN